MWIGQADSAQVAAEAERSALVSALKAIAGREGWSLRDMARKAGFPWSSWTGLASGRGNAAAQLPKLRSAVARLGR